MAKWMITVRQPYVRLLVNGEKTMEIRTRVPNSLNIGDTIYIVEADSFGRIVGAFLVEKIMRYSIFSLIVRKAEEHKVPAEKIVSYAGYRSHLYGITLEKVNSKNFPTNISVFGKKKAPKWFAKLSD